MHELSLVLNIVDIAEEQAKVHASNRIESIELEIGSLAGVEMAAFNFAWESAIKNTVLEKCERIIQYTQAISKCFSCQQEHETEELFSACPNCGAFGGEIQRGRELRVKSLTLEQERP